MNAVKKMFGIAWMILSAISVYYVLSTAITEISAGQPADAPIFWPVIITIFIPIAVGLGLFGYYAIKGEYEER